MNAHEKVNTKEILKGTLQGIATGIVLTFAATVAGACTGLFNLRYGPAIYLLPPLVEVYIVFRLCDKYPTQGRAFGYVSIVLSMLLGLALALAVLFLGDFSDLD